MALKPQPGGHGFEPCKRVIIPSTMSAADVAADVGAGTRFGVSTRFRQQGQYEVRISSILEADVASSDW
ncbi:hypothetical protein Tco_1472787 [Tanacetum coccineum]